MSLPIFGMETEHIQKGGGYMDYKDFRKKLATDSGFAAKFGEITDLDKLIEAAAAEGFSFTKQDVKNDTELLPEELAFATGGTTNLNEKSSVKSINPELLEKPHVMNTDG